MASAQHAQDKNSSRKRAREPRHNAKARKNSDQRKNNSAKPKQRSVNGPLPPEMTRGLHNLMARRQSTAEKPNGYNNSKQMKTKKNHSANSLKRGTALPLPKQAQASLGQRGTTTTCPSAAGACSSGENQFPHGKQPYTYGAVVPLVLRLDVRGPGLREALREGTLKAPCHLHPRVP